MPTRPAKQPLTVMPQVRLADDQPGGDGGGEHGRDGRGVGVTRMCMTSAGCWKLMVEPG